MSENKTEEKPPEAKSEAEEKSSTPKQSSSPASFEALKIIDSSFEEQKENKDEPKTEEKTSASGPGQVESTSSKDMAIQTDNTEDTVSASDADQQVYYSIDDVINAAGYGKFQKLLTVLAGLGWFADACAIIVLSIIGDMIACDWTMQRWQNALLTSSIFIGMTFGAPAIGYFADRCGRRLALAISMLLMFVFGAASAAAPDYAWLVVLRALIGFTLGGIAQGVTLCMEYYPASVRGEAGFYLSYYWTVGTLAVLAAAWIIMKHMDNWKIYLFVSSVPALIVFLTMKWYPESARYYLVSNQPLKARITLERLVRMNNAEMPKGRLIEVDGAQERGRFRDLLKPKMRRTTLIFWYLWIAVSLAYYGIALVTPVIIVEGSLIASRDKHANVSVWDDFTVVMPCRKFSNRNFFDLIWTSAAEFPGLLIFTFVVEGCERRIFLGSSCLITAIMILFLLLQTEPAVGMLLILFICRALVAGVFQLLFVMTSEAFPTTLRASAMGTGSGCARLGGLLIPYIAQGTVIARPVPSISVLAAIVAIAGVATFFLPRETRGKNMQEVISEEDE